MLIVITLGCVLFLGVPALARWHQKTQEQAEYAALAQVLAWIEKVEEDVHLDRTLTPADRKMRLHVSARVTSYVVAHIVQRDYLLTQFPKIARENYLLRKPE